MNLRVWWKWFKKSRKCMAIFVAVIALTVIYTVANARATLWLSYATEERGESYYWVVMFLGITMVTSIAHLLNQGLKRLVRCTFYSDLERALGEKIANCDYQVYEIHNMGYLETIRSSLREIANAPLTIYQMCFSLLVMVCALLIFVEKAPKLILPILGIVMIGCACYTWINKRIGSLESENVSAQHKKSDTFETMINGFDQVRSFGMERAHLDFIEEQRNIVVSNRTTKSRYIQGICCVMEAMYIVLTGMVLIYGVNAIRDGSMSPSLAVTLAMMVQSFVNPASSLMDGFDTLSENLAGMKEFDTFMEYQNTVISGDIKLDAFENGIKFSDVDFSYNSSDMVLKGISMEIPKGSKIGICGKSGGGKTTFTKLLSRFYDPVNGSIEIDNINLKDLTLQSLRKRIGMVTQDIYIIKGTIRENITYSKSGVSEVELVDACKKASIYDFIKSLPDGFDTDVGPNGLKLSGGQKQRLAIARVFLNNPDIVILDEATSSLDNESERIVQESLKLFEDKTVITVAHRLTTIESSDTIYVLDNHSIAESGTHEELLAKGGIYAGLYKKREES